MFDYAKYLHSNHSDEKYTPRYAVLPIIKYLPKNVTVWCPFDTEHSEFVIALREHGYKVEYSHIFTGQDFYLYEPERWDIIVSNPPFSNKARVFERCLSFGKPFALLMSNFWLNDTAPAVCSRTRNCNCCSLTSGYNITTLTASRSVRVIFAMTSCPNKSCLSI